MSVSRKLFPVEGNLRKFRSMLQLALQMESEKAVTDIVEYLSKSVIGLRLRVNGDNLESRDDYVYKCRLPNSENFKNLQQAAKFTFANCTPDLNIACGSIAYNDHQVVLNIPHIYSDGGYFRFLLKEYLEKGLKAIPSKLGPFNSQPTDPFKERVESSPTNVTLVPFDKNLTRIHSHHKTPPFNSNEVENYQNDIVQDKILNQQSNQDEYITTYWKDINEFKNLNKNRTAPNKFTEQLYLANYFAACANEKELLDKFGINTVVDMRKYFSRPEKFEDCSHVAFISPFCTNIDKKMPLSEVAGMLRNSLESMLKRGDQFGIMHSSPPKDAEPQIGNYFEISNMGPLEIRRPVLDLWVSMEMKACQRNTIANMAFSVSNKGEKRNDFVTRFRWNPNLLTNLEASKMANCVNYFLRNVTFDRTIESVNKEINEFYNSF